MTTRWLVRSRSPRARLSSTRLLQPTHRPRVIVLAPPAQAAALEAVFAHFKLDRLRCTFSEEKQIALLANPLRATRDDLLRPRQRHRAADRKARIAEQLVVTTTAVRIRKGSRTEEIPLDKSKDLKAFALIIPTLLQGDRAGLEQAFASGCTAAIRIGGR